MKDLCSSGMLTARLQITPAYLRRVLAVGKIEPSVSLNDVKYYDFEIVTRAIEQTNLPNTKGLNDDSIVPGTHRSRGA